MMNSTGYRSGGGLIKSIVLFRHLPGGTKGNHAKPESVGMTVVRMVDTESSV